MLWTRYSCRPRGQRLQRVIGLFLAILQVASLSAAQVASPSSAQLAPPSAAQEPGEYVVGSNDVLAVTVVDQLQLTGKYIVRADGSFTFPLIGRLQAGGLSLQAIEDDIRERLGKGYLKDPQVGVSVDQYRSQQIFVMGEVRNPGSLQFTGSMTIIEALARAGSTTDRAGPEALIVRQQSGAPQLDSAAIERARTSKDSDVIHVNLQDFRAGGLPQAVTLRSGDTIFVPRAESVFVSGQVRTAGEYVMRPGMTIRQLLALAGGVTERGSDRRIQIIRKANGVETTVDATLQDTVRPGDTIVVRERLF